MEEESGRGGEGGVRRGVRGSALLSCAHLLNNLFTSLRNISKPRHVYLAPLLSITDLYGHLVHQPRGTHSRVNTLHLRFNVPPDTRENILHQSKRHTGTA
jgi:hypothetical protein